MTPRNAEKPIEIVGGIEQTDDREDSTHADAGYRIHGPRTTRKGTATTPQDATRWKVGVEGMLVVLVVQGIPIVSARSK